MLLLTYSAPAPEPKTCAVFVKFNVTTRLYDCVLSTEQGKVTFGSHWEFNKALALLDDGIDHFQQRGYDVTHWFIDSFIAEFVGFGRDFEAGYKPT